MGVGQPGLPQRVAKSMATMTSGGAVFEMNTCAPEQSTDEYPVVGEAQHDDRPGLGVRYGLLLDARRNFSVADPVHAVQRMRWHCAVWRVGCAWPIRWSLRCGCGGDGVENEHACEKGVPDFGGEPGQDTRDDRKSGVVRDGPTLVGRVVSAGQASINRDGDLPG
jgi:hypothetical protein